MQPQVFREMFENPVTGAIETAEFDHPPTPAEMQAVMKAAAKEKKKVLPKGSWLDSFIKNAQKPVKLPKGATGPYGNAFGYHTNTNFKESTPYTGSGPSMTAAEQAGKARQAQGETGFFPLDLALTAADALTALPALPLQEGGSKVAVGIYDLLGGNPTYREQAKQYGRGVADPRNYVTAAGVKGAVQRLFGKEAKPLTVAAGKTKPNKATGGPTSEVKPPKVEPKPKAAKPKEPKLNTVKLPKPMTDMSEEELKQVEAALKAKHKAAEKAVAEGRPVVGGTGAIQGDLEAVQGFRAARAEPPPVKTPDEPEGTALQNKVLNRAQKYVGIDDLDEPEKVTMRGAAWRAAEKGYHKPENAVRLADDVIKGTTKHLDHEQSLGMAAALDDLLEQHGKLSKQSKDLFVDQSVIDNLNRVRDDIGKLTEAGIKAGTEWGRSGVARQAVMKADGSYAGIVARRSKIVQRSLTTAELQAAKAESEALQTVVESQAKRIAELESTGSRVSAQEVLTASRKAATKEKIAKIDLQLKDAGERLKKKWAESAPPPNIKASVFGVDIAAEQLARIAHVAPELAELAKLYAAKGFVTLADNAQAVVAHLKQSGIDGITENDVAAALAGKARRTADQAEKDLTAYQSIKVEARKAFQETAEAHKRELREIAQAARESGKKATALKRAKAQADAKNAREAEKFFWEWIGDQEKAFRQGVRNESRLDRNEYIRWWRASEGGQRAGLLNRIDNLTEKLRIHAEEGFIPGKKSNLPLSSDPQVQKLRIQAAALRNRMDKAERQMRIDAEADSMKVLGKLWHRWNPFTLTRAGVASLDNSFPLNQGSMALFSNPKQWLQGFKDSWKGFSPAKADEVLARMRADDDYVNAQAAGLFEEGADIADVFGAEINLPGFKHSQNAYELAGKSTRFELFKSWKWMAEAKGGKPMLLEDMKVLADEVKAWTGQGKWGKNLQSVSKPFFALRYRLSQFEVAFGAPLVRTWAHAQKTGNYGPFKMMLGRYGQAYATAIGTTVIAAESLERFGPKNPDGTPMVRLEWRPSATNFGRLEIRKGKTVQTFDMLPPAMRFTGLAYRVVTGKRVTISGKEQDESQFGHSNLSSEMVGDWATNGLTPLLNMTWQAYKAQRREGKEMFGKSYDFKEPGTLGIPKGYWSIASGFLPIPVQNAKEIWENKDLDQTEKIIATGLLPILQQGTNEQK